MCEYSNGGYSCEEDGDKDKGGFCIFHCDKEDFNGEEIKKFEKEFWEVEFKRQEKFEVKFDFVGFKFPKNFSFEGREFKKVVNFRWAEFSGKADFRNANFSGMASLEIGNKIIDFSAEFSNVIFKGEADFRGAEFISSVNFSETKFNGEAIFWRTTFNGTDFHMSIFNGEAIFWRTTFNGETKFTCATFDDEVHFGAGNPQKMTQLFSDEAKYMASKKGVNIGDLNLDESELLKDCGFLLNKEVFKNSERSGNEKWMDDAELPEIVNKVDYLGAEFNGDVFFADTTFEKYVSFLGVKFAKGRVNFAANFNGIVNFKNTTFEKDAGVVDFRGTTFKENVNFSNANFSKIEKVLFLNVGFQKAVKFVGGKKNKIFKPSVDSLVNFSNSRFGQPERVEFVDVNLSKTSFLHCKDFDKIGRFEKIKWASKGKIFKRKAVYDEIKIDESDKEDKHYEYVAEVYRKLRLNYERNLRFSEAGDFYIGEMEMRRKNVKLFGREIKNRILNLIFRNISLTAWYRNFSYYGENYFLPLLWIFAAIIGFGYLFSNEFLASAQIFFWIHPPEESLIIRNFELGINFIISSGWFVLLERILSVLFIALFVLALRRKFKKGGE